MKEITQIFQSYNQACAQHKRVVLATVVHIEGSAYRAPGARMLITEDGTITGAVSGGCLEGDVLRKALLVMAEEKPLLVTYDTSDEEDAVIGISLGCNGIIRILLEPLTKASSPNAVELLQHTRAQRQPSVVVTFFCLKDKRNGLQGTGIVYSHNKSATSGELPFAVSMLETDMDRCLASEASAFLQYPNGFTAFIEYMTPPPALIIAGAGNDVMPLVQMAESLGWPVTLLDGRPAYANVQRFPGCQVMVTAPEKALDLLHVDAQTAIVLMSHNYRYDKAILAAAAGGPARYIGILGPHRKKERLLEDLALPFEQTANIYGPTGLDIGAETPEEIALSVIAEIKAVFASRHGGFLRNTNGHIHTRHSQIVSANKFHGA